MSSIDSFSQLFPYFNTKLRKCEQILSFIGLYFVCKLSSKVVYKILRFGYIHIWSQIRGNHLNESKGWAVITFVSNGTGVSFAKLLAQKGFDLILIDENEYFLEVISNQILSEYRVRVMTTTVDLTKGFESYESIKRQMKDKTITLLINNISLSNQLTHNYTDLSDKQLFYILNKEMLSVLIMSSMVLPQMKIRGKGYIINVSSILCAAPIPYLSVHSASKAFIDRFSTALSYECKANGIVVQSLMPSLISDDSWSGVIAPTHQTYAKSAFNTIGRTNRTTGYLWHDFHLWLLERTPQHFTHYFSRYFLKSNVNSYPKQ